VCARSEIRQATKGKRKRRGVAGKKRGCTLPVHRRESGRKKRGGDKQRLEEEE
jgi:hypothetical protein